MNDQQKDELVNVSFTETFKIGEVIAKQEDYSHAFYIIKQGSVLVYKGDKFIQTLDEGSEFGNK